MPALQHNTSIIRIINKNKGFTLVELMIVMIVVAIIAMIALPTYQGMIRKTRRAEALETLYRLQVAQEKWRSTHTAYGSLANLGFAATTTSGNYSISVTLPVSPGDQTAYSASATAVAGTSQVDDTAGSVSCATLTINQDEPVYSPAGQAACWGR